MKRSVLLLLDLTKKCPRPNSAAAVLYDAAHPVRVARLALALFDGLRSIHGLGDEERPVSSLRRLVTRHRHPVGCVGRSQVPAAAGRESAG